MYNQRQQHYQLNKDRLKASVLKYYHEHKEERKEYELNNRDKRLKYKKEWNDKHKEEQNARKRERVICDVCNKEVSRHNLSAHKQTKSHMSLIK